MLPLLIFTATYAIVALGRAPFLRIDRTGAAVIGAILMVVTGAIGFDDAAGAVDFRTLVLLFGMMVLVAHLRLSGALAALVRAVSSRLVHPAALLAAVVFASGILSALFVNDTICLVFTPLVLELAVARGHRPLPYLVALATASNIGSVATITGNPQNMLIGTTSGLSFRAFTSAMAPIAIVGLALDAALLWAMFRRDFAATSLDAAALRAIRPHKPMLVKTLVVAAGMLAGFLAGYEPALVAAGGAAVLLLTRRVAPRKIYAAIDWDLLMLFAGLFVVVGAAERTGLARRMFELLQPLRMETVWGLSATTTVLANAIGNVPAVMLFTTFVPHLPDPARSWRVLAMASTVAGNLTIPGSIANLIVVEGARRRGVIVGFGEYARVGVPITLLTLAFGVWWLA